MAQPTRDIVENAGADGALVVGKLQERGDRNFGSDAQQGEYVDMVKAGIVDPTKVNAVGSSKMAHRLPAC